MVSKTDSVPSPAVVLDLLTLALSDINLRGQLVQVLEDSMRFACVIPHIWLQFALALVVNQQNAQALAVFHECVKVSPSDPLVLSTAANFAVEKAGNPDLCIECPLSLHVIPTLIVGRTMGCVLHTVLLSCPCL